MNWTSLLITLHIAMVCIAGGIARPTQKNKSTPGSSSSSSSANEGRSRDLKRSRSGRKLRMLHKMLKRLTPEDVLRLSRSKKDKSYYEYNDSNTNNHQQNKYMNNSPLTHNSLKQEHPSPLEIGRCLYLLLV